MTQTAKLFMNGRSQAVRLPAEFRFEGKEVSIRKDPKTGEVILSRNDFERFFQLLDELGPAPPEFMEGIDDPVTTPEDVF